VLPECIAVLPGDHQAECPEHGWQDIVRKATIRECANQVLGLPLDYRLVLPDEPPFLPAIPA
jgi:hypothetical protein